jgi:hypothetical protein
MDSIKGAIVLRQRVGDAAGRDTPVVPPDAPAIYHWVAVAPSEPEGVPTASDPPQTAD